MYKIVNKQLISPQIYRMDVLSPRLANSAKPGQFLIIIIDEKGERIPLTICDYDAIKGTVAIVFQVVGKSTELMASMNVGDAFADFVGPLGSESEFIHEDIENLKKKSILFIAGGVGTAPIYPQVKWLSEHGIKSDVIIGARSKEYLFMLDEMKAVAKNVFICTDDGSEGLHGRVTDMLTELVEKKSVKYDEVIAIGPMIMMKFVAELTKKYSLKTIVSLNSLMVDGTGMCGACRVTVGGKTKFTCVDGPEFDAHEVNFDEAMRRQGMYKKYEIAKNTDEHKCNLAQKIEEIKSCEIQSVEGKTKTRVPVREQEPTLRILNFEEVCYGYNLEEAMLEASRCINCKIPSCVSGCPVNINIPAFIQEVKKGDFNEAARIISMDSALPAVCGRVCPQEKQCEGKCIIGIKSDPVAIGKLERFVADWSRENNVHFYEKEVSKGIKVAVIGSGPAGLTCASDLAKKGYDVTVFEALHQAGGVLVYGIPEFRLPKNTVVKSEIDNLKNLGVKIETNVIIGKTITIEKLMEKEGFKAVFIGSGAGLPKFMNIPGENLNGVVSANELLTRSNLMKAVQTDYQTPIYVGKKVAVVGAGNVAIDAARTARRMGADVTIIYRRTEKEMPARLEEIHHAKEEGIILMTLTNPTEIIGDETGWVKGMKCLKMELGDTDASGRRSPIEIKDSEFYTEFDTIVMSLGTSPNPLISMTTDGLRTTQWKTLVANDETGKTTKEGVFAGGDAVTGAATVILAMGTARKAAKAIDEYLK